MRKFFYPKSIAVTGASINEDKINNNVIKNLKEMGYQGKMFGIGKHRGEVLGVPIYRSLDEIKEQIDLLLVMVPAHSVPSLLKTAGKLGIDRAVILTAGFNELGEEGDQLAKEIKEVARKHAIRFIGPNCQGVICANSGVFLPFAPFKREQIMTGGASLLSQSGSLSWRGAVFFSQGSVGISKVASIGNKLDVNEVELLEYLIKDPETKVIVLYLESFSDGRKLYELAKNSSKPIIIFKSNVSGRKSQLALSHTAALASDDRIVDAALAQAGVLRAYTNREMVEMCRAFSLPLIKGKNLAVLAASGGMGIIAEDSVQRENLTLPKLPQHILDKIRSLADWDVINITNPIDTGGFFNISDIIEVLNIALSLEEVDGVVLTGFIEDHYCKPLTLYEVMDKYADVINNQLKPVAISFVTDPIRIEKLKRANKCPLFDTVEDSVRALSTQWKYRTVRGRVRSPYRNMKIRKGQGVELMNRVRDSPSFHDGTWAMELSRIYGIPCEMPLLAGNLKKARLRAAEMGYPVVMKISSPDIAHKSDAGGVKLDIHTESELDKAFSEIMDSVRGQGSQPRIQGVMLQRMISGGMEMILGGKYDNDFGPVVMVGMGGIFVETLQDVSFRLAPICREEAYEMIEELKGFPLLKGARGEEAYDISSLADALERLSILLSDFPQITELDLNPVKIFNDGRELTAVDGRIEIEGQNQTSTIGRS